jgi:hypothetical protein
VNRKPEPILFLSDARGVYIPRDFAESIRRDCLTGASDEDMATLAAGPDGEWYWDAWTAVCDGATVTDPNTGIKYSIYQDGDCWLIPEGMIVNDAGELEWPHDCDTDGHEFGPVALSRFAGVPNRKCTHCGLVSLDLDDEGEEA